MTNAQIIFNERVRLMEEQRIGTTGRVIEVLNMNGETEFINEPEEIHTYQAWKALGYQVKRGEKAIAKFTIWKYKAGKVEVEAEGDGEEQEQKGMMFMKLSHFFSESQVEAVKKNGAA